VPLHRPIEVAEQLAMLDILSGGRLRVGVVRAFVNSEFRAYNIDMGESRDRFNEGVEIMIRAWSEERFSYHGKFNRLDNVRLTPKPVQKPYPRIMVGSVLTRESFEYAGRMGFDLGVVPYITPMEAVIEKIGWYHEALRAAGRDPKDHTVMASLHVFVHEDPVKAKEIPREAVPAYVRYIRDSVLDDQWSADYKHYKGMAEQLDKLMDYEVLYEERTLIGTPERVIEKIKAWEAAGVNEISFLIVLPVLSMDEIAHSLRLFTRAVMPAFATTEGVRAAVAGE
jgi:alkanesulfonate monooxygenase SsuD/methylene tetrahydromethanopterin reductase-like flavin-dependent oxidoreductase (luciferase family)